MYEVVIKYESGEVNRVTAENYDTAMMEYFRAMLNDEVDGAVLYNKGLFTPIIVSAYSNSWDDDFIDLPPWAEEDEDENGDED